MVDTASNRSMTSSLADASSVRMKATRVAARRSSGNRATACAFAAPANRANAAALPGGTRSSSGKPVVNVRISVSRSMARLISGPLCRYGPSRSRSSGLCRPSSATATSVSSQVRCSDVSLSTRRRWTCAATRVRTRAISRSRTDNPGNITLNSSSHVAAASNRADGRSVPVQHSAYETMQSERDAGIGEDSVAIMNADARAVPPSSLGRAISRH